MDDVPEQLTKTEARAGTTPHITRYVLIFGLLLVLVAFIAILLFYMRG
jgi:Flp pilus assembly protein TadB